MGGGEEVLVSSAEELDEGKGSEARAVNEVTQQNGIRTIAVVRMESFMTLFS